VRPAAVGAGDPEKGDRSQFDRDLLRQHDRLEIANAEADALRMREELRREQQRTTTQSRGDVRCTWVQSLPPVLHALEVRASTLLSNGQEKQALAVCEQIILLDPVYRFDADFWGNGR
jgi:hypothetical protein